MKGKITCGHCTLMPDFITFLQGIDFEYFKKFNKELYALSGGRCVECNKKVGGSPNSEHISGEGIDVLTGSSQEKGFLIPLLLQRGITRIGDNRGSIHIGFSKTLPQNVFWDYYK